MTTAFVALGLLLALGVDVEIKFRFVFSCVTVLGTRQCFFLIVIVLHFIVVSMHCLLHALWCLLGLTKLCWVLLGCQTMHTDYRFAMCRHGVEVGCEYGKVADMLNLHPPENQAAVAP